MINYGHLDYALGFDFRRMLHDVGLGFHSKKVRLTWLASHIRIVGNGSYWLSPSFVVEVLGLV